MRAELLQALNSSVDESELKRALQTGAEFYRKHPDDTEVSEALKWAERRLGKRWPPKRCVMKDLSYLTSTLTIDYLLNKTFGGAGLQTEAQGQALFLNAIRILDKTLREYGEARLDLQRYVDSHNETSLLLQATDHMETCIGSLHRVFKHLTMLRARLHRLQHSSGLPAPEIDWKDIPKRRDEELASVRTIRDAVEHMDQEILDDKAGPGKPPIGLVVMSDSIELANKVISYEDLASWIEQALPQFFLQNAKFLHFTIFELIWPLLIGGGSPLNRLNQRFLGTLTSFFAVVAHAPLLPISSTIGWLWTGCRGTAKPLGSGAFRRA